MKVHELKCWCKYFERIFYNQKTFEVRKNDRDFMVGDFIHLREWDNDKQEYTGRELTLIITYILEGGQFGIEEGYCVMSIKIDY